jgi:hypothetical protein
MLSRLLGTMKSNGMHISRPACFLGESPTTQQPHIWYSWLGFIYSARIERGMYGHLQLRQNQSWLSCASYPLWPPTTFKESFDQLVYLQDKHADTWHNNGGHSLAHQHWQGHVISRILSIGMRMQGIFGSYVHVSTWIWSKTCLWLNNQLDGSVITAVK